LTPLNQKPRKTRKERKFSKTVNLAGVNFKNRKMKNKDEEILFNIYRELYKNSEPVGDFDELFKNATVNERGEKVIPFNDYVISDDKMEEIIKKHLKGNRITKLKQNAFRCSILLGCSPRSKK
jgi:hypothetical protein